MGSMGWRRHDRALEFFFKKRNGTKTGQFKHNLAIARLRIQHHPLPTVRDGAREEGKVRLDLPVFRR